MMSSRRDCLNDGGCHERQTRQALDIARRDGLTPPNFSERAHPPGGEFLKPRSRTRDRLEQRGVYLAR
jgi:hypothetical protein